LAILGSIRHWDPCSWQIGLGSPSGLPRRRWSEYRTHEPSQVRAATSCACLLCENRRVSGEQGPRTRKGENTCNVQNDQMLCCPDTSFRRKRRGAWNTKSPKIEAMRLNCGVNAFWVPVSYGEPRVTSWGYRLSSPSSSASVALGRTNFDK